jgi:Arc/MetJ-type ribon-helix-helix transcriptional regulator
MTMRLTPDQEQLVQRAVARGMAASAEDVVTAALRSMSGDLEPDLETRLGMDAATINRELDKGLQGTPTRWEGATAFHERMLTKHQGKLGGSSQE